MQNAKTWHLSVPIMLMPRADDQWDNYLAMLKRMQADRVLLVGPSEDAGDVPAPDQFRDVARVPR